MKRIFFATGFLAVLATASAYGQSLVGRVPFDFHLGKAVLPAGEYRIDQTGPVVIVRSVKGMAAAMKMTVPASRHSTSSRPSLEFRHTGSDYVLTKVWVDGSSGRSMSIHSRQEEMASNATPSKVEEVALNTGGAMLSR